MRIRECIGLVVRVGIALLLRADTDCYPDQTGVLFSSQHLCIVQEFCEVKKALLRRLALVLPITGLVGLMLSGFAYMGAFNFAGSAEAGCGGRLPYRTCRDRDRYDRHETKTTQTVTTIFTITELGN